MHFDTFLPLKMKTLLLCTCSSEGLHCHLSSLQMIRNGAILTKLGQGQHAPGQICDLFSRKDLVSPVACCLLVLRPSPLLLSKSSKR